ncbi:MAG: hypothetical protein JNK84_06465 [Phreatobacter sp.]|uniref:PepSY domain-containing protein n=1 Tax=Phreatobacter sp. TaxID=1966341 RepID=UPI001A47E4C1|nr:hypothetical protein [Phreatobacter sp.]MBL8568712.1 hypothetical protein [Phreatobacter sp.]
MTVATTFAKTGVILFGLAMFAGPAAAQVNCLNPADRRAAVAGGQALPLAQAQRNLRPEQRGEVINARLCRAGGNLLYLLTVVDRRGKVTRVRIEANTGQVVQVR